MDSRFSRERLNTHTDRVGYFRINNFIMDYYCPCYLKFTLVLNSLHMFVVYQCLLAFALIKSYVSKIYDLGPFRKILLYRKWQDFKKAFRRAFANCYQKLVEAICSFTVFSHSCRSRSQGYVIYPLKTTDSQPMTGDDSKRPYSRYKNAYKIYTLAIYQQVCSI